MTDPELVSAALEAVTGGNVTAFAALLGVDPSDVRAWRRGDVRLSAVGRRLMRLMSTHPKSIGRWLREG